MAQTAKGDVTVVELSRTRQAAVRRVAEAKATVPDFTVSADAPVPDGRLDAALVRAVAVALRECPEVNGAYRDGRLERYARVNVAVTLPGAEGPVAPVVYDADGKDAPAIAAELDGLAAGAAAGELTAPRLAGATFTVSGLGLRVRRLQPVIVPPQAAVLGAGAPAGGTLELTLVCDARALTPAEAAAFLERVCAGLGG